VLPCVAVCCRVLPCVALCCRVLHRVAVCCSVLQWIYSYCSGSRIRQDERHRALFIDYRSLLIVFRALSIDSFICVSRVCHSGAFVRDNLAYVCKVRLHVCVTLGRVACVCDCGPCVCDSEEGSLSCASHEYDS